MSTNGFAIRKAERMKRKARVAILGPTGSGKTLGALLIAKGFGGRTCLIDTERHSGDLYAGHKLLKGWEYDVLTLEPPFTVERYIEAIEAVQAGGYDNAIVDSASHAWAGPGGILEFVDKKTEQQNKFVGWRDATPKHNDFVQRLVNAPMHMIVTMRVKMDYVLEENEKGKKVPKKVGLQPVQRDGLEYEFDVVFDLTTAHLAGSTKDRTSLFDGEMFTITPETGDRLKAWLGVGTEDPRASREKAVADWCAALETAGDKEILRATYDKAKAEVEPWGNDLLTQLIVKAKNKRLRAFVGTEAAA